MTRIPALGHPTLWRAAAELRAQGQSWDAIARTLAAETGRPVSLKTVYRLLEYAHERGDRRAVVLTLSRPRAARAAAAARVRGCTLPRLVERAVALLLDDPALLDAVLDDGVTTPRGAFE